MAAGEVGSEEQVGVDTVEYGRGMAGVLKQASQRKVGLGIGQGVAKMGHDDGFMKARAPAIQSSCEESRLIEAIVGAALWAEGGGKTGADEALLEEVSRYSLPENCSLLSFGDRGLLSSSSSFCGEKNEDVMAVRDLVALEGHMCEGEGLIKMDVMKLRVLSWNVRGANDSEKRKVDQESKGGCSVFTRDQNAGDDKRVLHLLEAEVGNFSVSCRFKNCEDDFCWLFSGVYGPSLMKEREDFWAELGAVRGLWSDPWCVAGDFNVVRFPVESSRGGLNNQSHSRLDRFLISNEWEDHFFGSVQYVLPKPTSDHFPILLNGGGVRSGLMPFRFENMWLKEEGFKEKMQGWWVGLNFSGSASYVLVSKLKALKSLLRDWNKLEFGKVEVNKALALSQVDFWDKMELSRTLSVQEVDARRGAKEDFKKWALMEEISWRQKSREVWLRERDRNTKFFHKMANAHRRGTCYPGSK
ncbi:hypothetical protein CK203_002338 [Vitis vinifera]|uniref:Endonuclease/exonuclease/phosphatase domain-containing protein n=1 Tax=Vitis vinifera TaxID=29760 RepID=A0A438KK60_VITVI|nr:hypothetical protein CK203_002338 [Vitis vinifera]